MPDLFDSSSFEKIFEFLFFASLVEGAFTSPELECLIELTGVY
jgi:hypothetical protein